MNVDFSTSDVDSVDSVYDDKSVSFTLDLLFFLLRKLAKSFDLSGKNKPGLYPYIGLTTPSLVYELFKK